MPAEGQLGVKNYPRYIEFPDGEGNLQTVDLEAEPDYTVLDEISRNPNAVNTRYFLFTRRNPDDFQELIVDNENSIQNSNYNPNLQTIVIAHGWLSNRNTQPNSIITETYLQNYDVNVIVVDWSPVSQTTYSTAVAGIPSVGRVVAQFINFLLHTAGGSLDNFHLIGFSLGAHVVGNIGRELGGRVARVTGLDPAGPLWATNPNSLQATDGVYVEAVHTDGGTIGLGLGNSIAQADFFPNGGISQPGCTNTVCHHEFAWALFASTITHNHLIGRECTNSLQILTDTCRGSGILHMGNADLRKTGRGDYRVNTGSEYPY